jgi:hypothetical protein
MHGSSKSPHMVLLASRSSGRQWCTVAELGSTKFVQRLRYHPLERCDGSRQWSASCTCQAAGYLASLGLAGLAVSATWPAPDCSYAAVQCATASAHTPRALEERPQPPTGYRTAWPRLPFGPTWLTLQGQAGRPVSGVVVASGGFSVCPGRRPSYDRTGGSASFPAMSDAPFSALFRSVRRVLLSSRFLVGGDLFTETN